MEARDQIPVTPEDQVLAILRQAKYLAQEYRQLTGKPLGITGEVAEYEAARILGLKLLPPRQVAAGAGRNWPRPSIPRPGAHGRCVALECRKNALDATGTGPHGTAVINR